MKSGVLKYNPSLASDEAIRLQFVARRMTLNLILEALRETRQRKSNQHILITGPRGAGKTTMLRRIAVELRTAADLQNFFLPVPFPEEAYTVTTAGEFWLEAIQRLADERRDVALRETAQQLNKISDDRQLREQALSHLFDFARDNGVRLVLLVENLGMLLKQMDRQSAWELRHTLLNEPMVIMIGTSLRNIFSGSRQSEDAWFEMFSVYDLGPLDLADTSRLWSSITGADTAKDQLRPIEILTGGNPRLIRIFAEFNKTNSLKLLLNSLVELIDEHTEYFKTQLDTLPVSERKVFVGVLDAWKPVTTSEVAAFSRISSKQCSSLLNRLIARGAVVASDDPRRKRYQAAERLFNIYYLLRRGGHPSQRIRAAVRFMTVFYEKQDLVHSTLQIAKDACKLEPISRADHYLAYDEILRESEQDEQFEVVREILSHTPDEFLNLDDLPSSIRDHIRESLTRELRAVQNEETPPPSPLSIAYKLELKNRPAKEVEHAYHLAIEKDPNNGHILAHLGSFLGDFPDRLDESAALLQAAVAKSPNDGWAWLEYGRVLLELHRDEDAIEAAKKSIAISPKRDRGYHLLANILHDRESFREAEDVLVSALNVVDKPSRSRLLADLAELYHRHLDRFDDAKRYLEEALRLAPKRNEQIAAELGELVTDHFGGLEEAQPYFEIAENGLRERLKKEPNNAGAWFALSGVLSNFPDRVSEYEAAIRRAVELDPTMANYWNSLMDCLAVQQRFDEAVAVAQSALKSSPNAKSWRRLGWVYAQMRRDSDAIPALRKAIEIDPQYVEAMTELSRVLLRSETAENLREAKSLLERVVRISGASSDAWPRLIGLMAYDGDESSQIISATMNFVNSRHRKPEALIDAAEALITDGRSDLNELAESLVKEAVGGKFTSKAASYILAWIDLDKGDISNALSNSKKFMEHPIGSSIDLSRTIDLAIRAAEAGLASEFLAILRKSADRDSFEALELALLKTMGKEVSGPQELMQVANDIEQRIKKPNRIIHRGPDREV